MDKLDFINWILNYFNVSDYIFQTESQKYNNGLLADINYLKLKEYVEKTYKFRPGVIEINKIATTNKFFERKEYKCPALRHYEYLKSTAIHGTMKDLNEETKEKIRAFLGKYGKKPSFDV